MKTISLLLAVSLTTAQAEPDGEQLFTTNCSACHLLDEMVVGPSLAEIRTIYNGKPELFVKWSIAPEQKRENVIEMPSMAHVGDEGLQAIYAYVMSVSDGVKIKTAKSGDPFHQSPTMTARPQVQRMFLPAVGPAAIAVALDDVNSLCWDAGSCRLRYAWSGGFIDGYPYWEGNGKSLAKISGSVFFTESENPLPVKGDPEFLGYSEKEGLPTFLYRIGSTDFSESFHPVSEGIGFRRTMTIDPEPNSSIILNFPENQSVKYSSDKGVWAGEKLKLQPSEAVKFTVTILRK